MKAFCNLCVSELILKNHKIGTSYVGNTFVALSSSCLNNQRMLDLIGSYFPRYLYRISSSSQATDSNTVACGDGLAFVFCFFSKMFLETLEIKHQF